MSQSIQSGKTTVTGSVTTATTISANIPLTVLSANNQSSGTTTLGTVPANKEWRIVGYSITGYTATNTAYTGALTLNAKGGAIGYLGTASTTANIPTHFEKTCMLPMGTYISVTAGNTVQSVFSGNGGVYATQVFYFEVDA